MSRHTINHPTVPDRQIVYGYDHPLCEYFWDVVVAGEVAESSMDTGDRTAFHLQEKLVSEEVWDRIPHAHAMAIVLDLPIPQTS